jgi:glutamyl-Q tRNA(Asp) synthetase
MNYIGRFAPTPSGDLHFGSLVTALASYLDAKQQQGKWLMRIEDADQPRVKPGSIDSILQCLDALGLHWDTLCYQSEHLKDYADILTQLVREERIYACECTRAQIASRGLVGQAYDGQCASKGLSLNKEHLALRIKLDARARAVRWQDTLQGYQEHNLHQQTGDFLLRRADGLPSYALTSVIDDWLQGVTHVVRGMDLLAATAPQIHLRQLLNQPTPQYAHLPLAVTPEGLKLSKMSHAKAIDWKHPVRSLREAFQFLKLPIEDIPAEENQQNHLNWAIEAWKMNRLENLQQISWPGQTESDTP